MLFNRLSLYGLFIGCVGLPLSAPGADWKDALKENIGTDYKMSKIGLDRIRVTQPGSVFVIQKDGISGDLATDATFTQNIVEDGQVRSPKGAVAFLQNKRTNHLFKTGDKAYLWKVSMDGDDLSLFFLSYDTYSANERGGRSNQMRYKILVDFKFPKDYLPTAEWPKVKEVVQQIVVPEDEIKAAPAKTISSGQSTTQVEGILGKPEKIVDLGSKVTYIYKDMKVVFVDGKVADVQ
jgi:hypothetical protein